MENVATRKLTVTGSGRSYYVTIPKEMIKHLKWKKGEKKCVRLEKGKIVIEDWEG